MRKLKVAQIVNIWQAVPPIGYGGTEIVVYNLCEGLVKQGHEVVLFATGDSKTAAKLSYLFKKGLLGKNILWNNYLYPLTHFTRAYAEIKKAGDFDIIHGHLSLASDLLSLALAHLVDIPSVFTLHFVLPVSKRQEDRRVLFEYVKDANFVSISDRQRKLPLNFVGTVYHGYDLDEFPFSDNADVDSLMWLGRIVLEKGLEEALEVSRKLRKKIVVAGRIDRESEVNYKYFQEHIADKLNQTQVDFIEEVKSKQRNELLMKSRCLLFPISWEEPFGLVMIEAMACGTPVVAFAQGSVPEVIEDGETGFIVNISDDDRRGDWIIKKTGIEGLIEAVEEIYSLPDEKYRKMRRACREHVQKKFSREKVVESYERVYQKVITRGYFKSCFRGEIV